MQPATESGCTNRNSTSLFAAAFFKSPASCNGLAADTVVGGYNAIATPIAGGGSRAFGTNTSNTVYAATQTTALTMTDTTPDAAAKPIQ